MAKKILVIEDNDDLLEILNIVFQGAGYEVILSKIALDVDYINVLHPDLIFLDVRIVGSSKNGSEVCRALKADDKTKAIPVVLLSAEPDLNVIAMESSADGFISKPFDIDNLLFNAKKILS
jgi:two-component system response regulator VicR